ncbi:MAG TPA: HD-GYP domain-containing protein [Candidatus Limnocylindria bacterium]|nr:HD-GYP domain-containing protein [Candidatus Limnocylindria bacterium]
MNSNVRLLIIACTAAAAVAVAAAAFLFPIRRDLGGAPGFLFWIGLTLIGSALPVRLPRGTVVSVSAAPFLATLVLGGPFAAALVAGIGSTDYREVRRQIPWYGTLFNHASVVFAVVVGGAIFELIRREATTAASPASEMFTFVGLLVGSGVYYAINAVLALMAVSARTGIPMRTVWAQDLGAILASLLGLAPLSWLMAQIFLLPNGVGWWATPLFVVPLFTTRLAYHRYVETRELFEQTIGALANAVDARDRYTRGHSNRVSHIATEMCRVMKLPEAEVEKIHWAGLLHDVGKIGIRDNILLKEGPLDKEERYLMNQHPSIGAEIVSPAKQLSDEAPLIRAHHEWFNGSGYPDGIEALDIPLGARILTIADAYEAMTSSRPYRKTPLTHEQAVGELQKYSGIQFDPEIVPVLVNLPREVLDRPPDRPDELPTMLQAPDPRDAGPDAGPDAGEGGVKPSQPASSPQPARAERAASQATQRPMLASDDVS